MSRRRTVRRAVGLLAVTLSTLGALSVFRVRLRGDVGVPACDRGNRGRDARDVRRLDRVRDRLAQRWARSVARRLGLEIVVEGEPPEEPVAIVANHLGYLDIVALWCVVPGVFVARADVAGWPLVGLASRALGTLFIDRARKRDLLRVLPQLDAVLGRGRNAIFFPEATSSPGADVLPFRSPLFEAAVRRGIPVVGVALQYETDEGGPEAAQAVCWWGDMTFADHFLRLLALPRIVVRIRFAEPIEATPDRKRLCRLAREAVVKKFIPTASRPIRATRPAYEGGSGR